MMVTGLCPWTCVVVVGDDSLLVQAVIIDTKCVVAASGQHLSSTCKRSTATHLMNF